MGVDDSTAVLVRRGAIYGAYQIDGHYFRV